MTPRQATEKTAQPTSKRLSSKSIPGVANGLDGGRRAELRAQAPHAHVDHVRTGIEAVAPHLGEQPLAAHDLAGVRGEVVQQPELAIGEIDAALAHLRA